MPKRGPAKKRAAPKRAAAKKQARVDPFHFENTDSDPIIENLKEVAEKYHQVRSIDNEILDHVALEGLTGATFGRLCLILDAVIPHLNSCHDDAAQDYIWSVIVNSFMRRAPGSGIQAFHLDLTKKRDPAKTQDEELESNYSGQNKNFCIDKAIKLPSQSLKRMAKSDWMLHPVLDGHIMGSCPNYKDRVNISQEVLRLFDELGPRESLLAVSKNYDLRNVYFVADQDVRRRALLPKSYDPNIDLKLREYACLELIGRTRCFGIVFPNDKTLGRYRILLTAKGLITQFQATCNTYIVHHLRRFSKFNIDLKTKAFKSGQFVSAKAQATSSGRDDDDDDDEVDVESDIGATIRGTCCNPARLKCDRDILKMVYDVIAMSDGRSLWDIRRKLKLPKSHIRNHLKNLANTELIGSHTRLLFEKKARIYRVRHKSNRRRIAREKRNMKGVMARWDEIDVRARRYLGPRRSSFSQAEDSLLTLCRITGSLIDPSYPKTFIVPKQIIRDILHDELPESYDKTSDSLLRRTKYLGRLEKNILLINEIIAELRDDSDVKRMLDCNLDSGKRQEKLISLFQQLFKLIKAKLPHLLGLTSSLLTGSSIEIESFEDLTKRFELIDCHKAPARKKIFHQPQCTLVQLVRSTPQCYNLRLTKCEDMQTVMLISSRCAQTCFNLQMKLKFPTRVVALDQENENFRVIFEKAKESREASRMIANLTTANPSADSRRALFMLRNAPKLQNMDKCGKLTDALIIQPCDIEFFSDEEITFNGKYLLDKFLSMSKFSNEVKPEPKESKIELAKRRKNEHNQMKRRQMKVEARSDQATTSSAAIAGAPSSSEKDSSAANASLTKQDRLFKMIESIMSWIGACPGIELDILKTKLEPLLGESLDEHSSELLELMESLELISCDRMVLPADMCQKPRLFGYRVLTELERQPVITFAPRENAYVRLCQLIDVEL